MLQNSKVNPIYIFFGCVMGVEGEILAEAKDMWHKNSI